MRQVYVVHAGWDGDVHISYYRPVRGAWDRGPEARELAEAQVEAGAEWAEVFWEDELVTTVGAAEVKPA